MGQGQEEVLIRQPQQVYASAWLGCETDARRRVRSVRRLLDQPPGGRLRMFSERGKPGSEGGQQPRRVSGLADGEVSADSPPVQGFVDRVDLDGGAQQRSRRRWVGRLGQSG